MEGDSSLSWILSSYPRGWKEADLEATSAGAVLKTTSAPVQSEAFTPRATDWVWRLQDSYFAFLSNLTGPY